MRLDLSSLTWGELRELRRLTGKSIVSGDPLDEDVVVHLLWLVRRRDEPDVTLEDIEAMPIGAVEIVADADTVPFAVSAPTTS